MRLLTLFFVCIVASSGQTLRQSGVANSNSGGTINVTLGSNTLAGDIIVVLATGQGFSGSCIVAPTDSASNTYTSSFNNGAGNPFYEVYSAHGITATSLTVHLASGCNFGSALLVEEWTNVSGLSVSAGNDAGATTAASGGAFRTPGAAVAICAFFAFSGGLNPTLSAGTMDTHTGTSNITIAAGFQAVAFVAATYTNTWSTAGTAVPVQFIFNPSASSYVATPSVFVIAVN